MYAFVVQASSDSITPSPAKPGKRTRSVDHATRPCPIGRAGELLGDRWTLLILRDANGGIRRFDDFQANLGIADNILAARLRHLVEAGLLVKVPYRDGNRTRQEYRLTQAGADFLPVLRALADWGAQYTKPEPVAEPMLMLHAGCGGHVNVSGTCDDCGQAVPREQEEWLRPWRSPEPIRIALPVTGHPATQPGQERGRGDG
jgi:DNA-binding HxlR family transcriptional regulator